MVRWDGVLAENAAWRCEVVPKAPSSTDAEKAERRARKLVKAGKPCAPARALRAQTPQRRLGGVARPRRLPGKGDREGAELLQRMFGFARSR